MPSFAYLIPRIVTPATSPGLISLEDAKIVLGIPEDDATQDDKIQAGIDSVSRAICNYCDRGLVAQTYRDTFREPCLGFGEPLRPQEYPIQTDAGGVPLLFNITVDDVAIDPTTYDLDALTARVWRDAGWAASRVIVDYKAGYDPIPPDLQAACSEWLVQRWMAQGRDPGVRSEQVFDVITVGYDTSGSAGSNAGGAEGPPPGVCSWLVPYKRWTV